MVNQRCAVFILSFTFATLSQAAGFSEDPHSIVPGYERFRGDHLGSADAGRLLISELNCQSCHGPLNGNRLDGRQAPILTEVGQRTSAEFLKRYLKNPHAEKPGTAMPKLSPEKLDDATIDGLVAFLTSGQSWRPAAVGVDAVRRGEKLFHQVGCAACHSDQRSDEEIAKIRKGAAPEQLDEDDDEEGEPKTDAKWKRPAYAMPLGKLDQKYSLGSLISFLREPHKVRPSGRMPSLNLKPEEARDIASYLLKDVKVEPNIHFEYFEGDWQKLPDFSKLTAANAGKTTDFSVGVSPKRDVFALRFSGWLHVPKDGEYRFFLSSDDGARLIVDGKVIVDNDGIHPSGFKDGSEPLTAGAHEVVVEYFEYHGEEELAIEIEGSEIPRQALAGLVTLNQQPPTESAAQTDVAASPELVQKGRAAFQSLGCAACHQHGDGDARLRWTGTAPDFQDARMKTSGGCLAEKPAVGLPQFSLTKQQREDATAAIEDNRIMRKITAEESARIHLQQTLLTFNCYACHARGTIGGVNESTNHLFVGSIPEMGDEGRIPPALDGAGDKLNATWLKTILNDGAKDRPYMATRMPRFGESNVGDLVGSLGTLDIQAEVPAVTFSEPEHRVKADARLMVGDQALSCIKCHIFDKYAATGIQSLDMTTMTRRLRRDWFHRYLANPQQYRPGTRMPAAWPNGRSVVPHILNGDSAAQIESIWLYLSDGKNAKIPSGLQREAIELKPIDRPIIYRNFLEGLSPRGIAVGFRQKVHFAWDAEHMTPRLIWHGAFIDASKHWVDRGPGNQTPLGDHIMTLPAGPPISQLPSLDQAWPKELAREHGFRFQGYRLSSDGTPTFRYQAHAVDVEDLIQPFEATPDNGLARSMTFHSSEPPKDLYVRIAAGGKFEEADKILTVDGVRYELTGVTPVVRTSNGLTEVLVPVTWQGNTASFTVRMRW